MKHDHRTPDLFPDLEGGRRARDRGMDRVMESEQAWRRQAMIAIRQLPAGWRGTGQDIREILAKQGLPRPHHHNCWGSLLNGCVREGLLVWTGQMGTTRLKKSHARAIKIYRRPMSFTERQRAES